MFGLMDFRSWDTDLDFGFLYFLDRDQDPEFTLYLKIPGFVHFSKTLQTKHNSFVPGFQNIIPSRQIKETKLAHNHGSKCR